ncbi:MAG: DUF1501 domain-containing protein [Pirellulales bacterium]
MRHELNLTRREMLHVGALSALGLSLPELFAARALGEQQPARAFGRRRPAKSCILFFMEGGPSHIDTFDLKPEAPVDYRGEFAPIATSVPGVAVCEHLPWLADQMHHVAQVRSVHHKVVDHNAGAYYCLTGDSPVKPGKLIIGPAQSNFPPFGSVLAKLRPADGSMPSFFHMAEMMSNNNFDLPGQRAGFLGGGYDPFVLGDVSTPDYRVPGIEYPENVDQRRAERRFDLLRQLTRLDAHRHESADVLHGFQQQARNLLTSPAARAAFDLSQESRATRERYGLPDREDRSVEARKFGGLPHLGQCLLMARRLVEAGTRLVTVGSGRRLCQAWDTHRDHFPLLKKSLLPYTDRAFAALLADLADRGLLEETLVVAMGEFGRTPKIGQVTSNAGADKNGRDHWPHCYTVLLAGGGIQGGAVYGVSDEHGAFPADKPVTPEDVAATIYYAMGLDPETEIRDHLGRPHPLARGKPITELFG